MTVLRCDYCGKEKDDVKVFAAKARLPSLAMEERLRQALQIGGEEVRGHPKLCSACEPNFDHILNA